MTYRVSVPRYVSWYNISMRPSILVIHAMDLRGKYRHLYEEHRPG